MSDSDGEPASSEASSGVHRYPGTVGPPRHPQTTVRTHIEAAMLRLGARNDAYAVAIALIRDQID